MSFNDLNRLGVDFIVYLQNLPIFTGYWEHFWLCCTKLGDPSWVFIVYVPLLYPFFGPKILQFMIAGAISEFLNGVFKWMMLSDRPYWWIHESNVYSILPPMKQFPLTCETGPGNPSGHSMISASVWFIFVSNLNTKKPALFYTKWIIFVIFLSLVAVSRLYIGTHFPHQVVFGAIVGTTIGLIVEKTHINVFRFRFCFLLSFSLLCLAALTFLAISLLDLDPNWSIGLAKKWCQKPEWINMSTTPLASLFRDIGALLGLGLVSEMRDLSKDIYAKTSFMKTLFASVLGLIVAQLTFIVFPNVDSLYIFYSLTCCQHFVIAVTILYGIPKIFYDFHNGKSS